MSGNWSAGWCRTSCGRWPERLAAGQRRSLSALKRKITGLAAEWGDTDYSVMAALSRICDSIDEADEQLRYVLEEKYLIRENDDI
ncbi:hypothetical protein LOT23_002688 [Salmonella enterica]|nr:hypothetical protein [Salmonella enterica]